MCLPDPLGEPILGEDPTGTDDARPGGLPRRLLLRGGVLTGAFAVAAGAQLWRPAAALAVAQPTIHSTSEWGAEPPRGTIQILDPRPTKIVVHYTAGSNSNDLSLAHAFQVARNIQQAHFARGFIDSGQQFTISRGGHIMTGRHHSKTELVQGADHVLGAHCTGQNEESVGIENEGTYTSVQILDGHYNKLVKMCAYICQQYGIAPGRIFGHRDFVATECPGDRLYARLPRLRDDVRALL
ncbi:MAG TPA: peptidoglycan recognition family protein [Micromonosporaceae bacterium]|nr:peptidoglycan recognition family protein [Micromonosporaceae bacterium]